MATIRQQRAIRELHEDWPEPLSPEKIVKMINGGQFGDVTLAEVKQVIADTAQAREHTQTQ